jgi:hypothetical protein
MQLPDIKKQGVGDKIKEGMVRKRARGRRKGDQTKKGKDGFQDGGMGEVDAQALLEIYKEQKQLHEALENELNKQGLGGSGQNALEKMKDRKQILNKGLRERDIAKILNVKQELLKLNSAVQQQGKKEATIGATKKSLIMILNRCQTHC